MTLVFATTSEGPGELGAWWPLVGMLVGFLVVVAGLTIKGRPGHQSSAAGRFLWRVPDALERLTGIPGWAAAATGTALYGLIIAGMGFYNDVAWHVALGRDKQLFTSPHTGIVIGLGFIAGASVLGVTYASLGKVPTAIHRGGVRIPWSMVAMAALGFAALCGFPLDELWHERYGIDVTMWSPTHMLMILGASFSPVAAWLSLAEAGVRPGDGRWARGVHVVCGFLLLAGLCSSQGEFDFGVPQFQQLYHPVLICIAAGFALVAIRTILGRGYALGISIAIAIMAVTGLLGGTGPIDRRSGGLFVVSGLAVEVLARVVGTERKLRFALASGVAAGTGGLAAEWLWNQGAHQTWTSALLPDAVLIGVLVAVGAGVLGAAFSRAFVDGPALGKPVVAAAAVAVIVGLLLPFPRTAKQDVTAQVQVERVGRGDARILATLDPPTAADGARWFQASAWQGGGLVLADMKRVGPPGRYVSEKPVPITGDWKTLLRLHRGSDMTAVAVWMPADAEIGKDEIPAVDRTAKFVNELQYLLREQKPGPQTFAHIVYALLAGVAILWAWTFTLAVTRPRRDPRRPSAPARKAPVPSGAPATATR